MSLDYKEIKGIFEKEYSPKNWSDLLRDVFPRYEDDKDGKEKGEGLYSKPKLVENVDRTLATKAIYLGDIILSKNEKIAVYEVELSDRVNIVRNRRGIRDMLNKDWGKKGNKGNAGAFIVSYPPKNKSVWRFSFVEEKDGDKETTATYLLGKGQECHTAAERFKKLRNSKKTIADVVEAFSVAALSDEFYKKLFKWYEWALSKEAGVTFPNNPETTSDDRENLKIKIIRLITRLLFVWFIKQKGLVPDRLFEVSYLEEILKDFDKDSKTDGCFYNAILQNLFFATLNCAIIDEDGNDERSFAVLKGRRDTKNRYRYPEMFNIGEEVSEEDRKKKIIELFAEVPFLNGGLFDCLDKPKDLYPRQGCDLLYDGFSRCSTRAKNGNYKYRAFVPNNLFFSEDSEHLGLITLLKQYNFTVEENSTDDTVVSLDPELLGQVFERLLAAKDEEDDSDDDDEKKDDRKSTGSYYTPRPIVDFMVDESLIEYIKTKQIVGVEEEALKTLFKNNEKPKSWGSREIEKVTNALKSIKILDPACGSGAFPMGCLLRIVEIIEILNDYKIDRYALKLEIIENCIYGVDIQSIAMLICKLRFFISLICDQGDKDLSRPESNFGVSTLPNLETKFVAANTLKTADLRKEQEKQSREKNPHLPFYYERLKELKEELMTIRKEHFESKRRSVKLKKQREDEEKRQEIQDHILDNTKKADKFEAAVEQLTNWDPYDQNSVNPFLDTEWMFGVSEGFDIIIGNPPYINMGEIEKHLKTQYKDEKYETFDGDGDIYCLFYERGLQLLKPGGHLCFITSNKWMCNDYGEKLRGFFAKNTNPKLLIDFAGVKIFKSAAVDTNILLFSNSSNSGETLHISLTKQDKNRAKNLSAFVEDKRKKPDNKRAFNISDSWSILTPDEQDLKNKIENLKIDGVKKTKTLEKLMEDKDIEINYGIKTGRNEVFHIFEAERREILENCESDKEREETEKKIIQPFLKGEDIKRYGYNDEGRYLIYIPWHFPYQFDNSIKGASREAEVAFKEQYPAVYSYLAKHKDSLMKRNKSETGIRYEWYALQRWGADYWSAFSEPKIVYGQFQDSMEFAFAKDKIYLSSNEYFIVCRRYPIKCLLGFLNSKVMEWLLGKIAGSLSGDAKIAQKSSFMKLSVPILENADTIKKLEDLVEKRIAGEASDSDIDRFIYDFYGLTPNEIEIIESQTS